MQSKRVSYIDIARGLAIIFVVYSHLLDRHDYRYLFYAFHMPFFFFLSGMFFRPDQDFLKTVAKSAMRLLVPYLTLALIMYAIWFVKLSNPAISDYTIKQFWSIFYANSNNGLMAFNNILWFLPTLFITRVFFAAIFKLTRRTKVLIANLVFLSVAAYLFSTFLPNTKLPFGTETAFSATVFYGMGSLWFQQEKAQSILTKNKYLLFPLLLLMGGILATIDFQNFGHQIDIRMNHLNNYFFFYFDAFCGIFGWLAFSIILNKNKLLEYIGRHSLAIFAWHPLAFKYIVFPLMGDLVKIASLAKIKIFFPIIYTVIATGIILFVDAIYQKTKTFLSKLTCKRP